MTEDGGENKAGLRRTRSEVGGVGAGEGDKRVFSRCTASFSCNDTY